MVNGFGCPKYMVHLFKPQQPSATSSKQPREKIKQLIHRAIQTGLSGAYLDALTTRYQENLAAAIKANSIFDTGNSLIELPDLNAFVENRVFEAAV